MRTLITCNTKSAWKSSGFLLSQAGFFDMPPLVWFASETGYIVHACSLLSYPLIRRVKLNEAHVTLPRACRYNTYLCSIHIYEDLLLCLLQWSQYSIFCFPFDVREDKQRWDVSLSIPNLLRDRPDSADIKPYFLSVVKWESPAQNVFVSGLLSSAMSPPAYVFVVSFPAQTSPFPPSLSVPSSLPLSFQRGMGWLSVSVVNCPFWHRPRSIMGMHWKWGCRGDRETLFPPFPLIPYLFIPFRSFYHAGIYDMQYMPFYNEIYCFMICCWELYLSF